LKLSSTFCKILSQMQVKKQEEVLDLLGLNTNQRFPFDRNDWLSCLTTKFEKQLKMISREVLISNYFQSKISTELKVSRRILNTQFNSLRTILLLTVKSSYTKFLIRQLMLLIWNWWTRNKMLILSKEYWEEGRIVSKVEIWKDLSIRTQSYKQLKSRLKRTSWLRDLKLNTNPKNVKETKQLFTLTSTIKKKWNCYELKKKFRKKLSW